jgi:hypothetical protein
MHREERLSSRGLSILDPARRGNPFEARSYSNAPENPHRKCRPIPRNEHGTCDRREIERKRNKEKEMKKKKRRKMID